MKIRFKIDKLVRDNISNSTATLCSRTMDDVEYAHKLKDKLLEETLEVIATDSPQDIKEECADLLEVMLSILKLYQIKFEDIEKFRAEKRLAKGGFDKKIYCAFAEMNENDELVALYRERSDKYPEIK